MERLFLILDNARIHHAKLIQPFLVEQKKSIEPCVLPPYSPELNLIEGLWEMVKNNL